jgi:arginase
VDMGPSAFRIAGLGERIASSLGRPVVDEGDLEVPIPETRHPGDARKRYIDDIALVCATLFEQVKSALSADALPLVLGGDHSLAAGSVAASAAWARERDGRIGLVWVDAHGDMNTPASSLSGNVHGMPLAALLGAEPHELAGLGGFAPKVDPERTVLIGVRNLDEQEKDRVRDSRIHVFTMKDIDRSGVAAVVEQAIQLAGAGSAGIHVSFDLDVCDPAIAPGVGTPVRGGLDYREAHMVMEVLADSGRLMALDMVEVNPTLDVRNGTAELATELVLSALGMKIL